MLFYMQIGIQHSLLKVLRVNRSTCIEAYFIVIYSINEFSPTEDSLPKPDHPFPIRRPATHADIPIPRDSQPIHDRANSAARSYRIKQA